MKWGALTSVFCGCSKYTLKENPPLKELMTLADSWASENFKLVEVLRAHT